MFPKRRRMIPREVEPEGAAADIGQLFDDLFSLRSERDFYAALLEESAERIEAYEVCLSHLKGTLEAFCQKIGENGGVMDAAAFSLIEQTLVTLPKETVGSSN
ncbi:MAG: hypothetical protein HQL52_07495 [Magnetococcales bacterium]|nr:hypothetical protein [Magnetococcales bacterium]